MKVINFVCPRPLSDTMLLNKIYGYGISTLHGAGTAETNGYGVGNGSELSSNSGGNVRKIGNILRVESFGGKK